MPIVLESVEEFESVIDEDTILKRKARAKSYQSKPLWVLTFKSFHETRDLVEMIDNWLKEEGITFVRPMEGQFEFFSDDDAMRVKLQWQ